MSWPRSSSNFSASRLVRLLARHAQDAGRDGRTEPQLAARVGRWLNLNDAISLSAVLNGAQAKKALASAEYGEDCAALRLALERWQEAFKASMVAGEFIRPGKSRIRLPDDAENTDPAKEAPSFMPYHRFYLAMQGEMENSLRQLRLRIRQALTVASAEGAALAALDAALGNALAERERSLLADVPQRLAWRFETLAAAGDLALFREELREMLQAELELRTLPLTGLIRALEIQAKPAPSP